MTGRQLMKWILDNNADDLEVVVQFSTENELYDSGEFVASPMLGNFCSKDGSIDFNANLEKNAIIF